MSKYICTNCGHEEEIKVVEKTITDDDGKQYKIKVSEDANVLVAVGHIGKMQNKYIKIGNADAIK